MSREPSAYPPKIDYHQAASVVYEDRQLPIPTSPTYPLSFKKEWVSLSREELLEMWRKVNNDLFNKNLPSEELDVRIGFYNAIEAALKERNYG